MWYFIGNCVKNENTLTYEDNYIVKIKIKINLEYYLKNEINFALILLKN